MFGTAFLQENEQHLPASVPEEAFFLFLPHDMLYAPMSAADTVRCTAAAANGPVKHLADSGGMVWSGGREDVAFATDGTILCDAGRHSG